jgi:hypothetical protein
MKVIGPDLEIMLVAHEHASQIVARSGFPQKRAGPGKKREEFLLLRDNYPGIVIIKVFPSGMSAGSQQAEETFCVVFPQVFLGSARTGLDALGNHAQGPALQGVGNILFGKASAKNRVCIEGQDIAAARKRGQAAAKGIQFPQKHLTGKGGGFLRQFPAMQTGGGEGRQSLRGIASHPDVKIRLLKNAPDRFDSERIITFVPGEIEMCHDHGGGYGKAEGQIKETGSNAGPD